MKRAVRFSKCGLALVAALLMSGPSLAKDFGVYGSVFDISEVDLLEDIAVRLDEKRKDGSLATLKKDFREQVTQSVTRPRALEHIGPAIENREWLFNPTLIVQEDISDHRGFVFVKKGETVNPLAFQPLRNAYLFVDGDQDHQIEWALEERVRRSGRVMIILVNGAPIDLMRKWKVPIMFDQRGYLTERFGIRAVPAVAVQDGLQVRIREIATLPEPEGLLDE